MLKLSKSHYLVVAAAFALFVGACSSDSGESVNADAGSDSQSLSASEWCLNAVNYSKADVPEDDQEAMDQTQAQVHKLADTAPAEVKPHVQVVAGVIDAAAQMDPDAEGTSEESNTFMEMATSPEVMEASSSLSQYLVEECGMDPEDSSILGPPQSGSSSSSDSGSSGSSSDSGSSGSGSSGSDSSGSSDYYDDEYPEDYPGDYPEEDYPEEDYPEQDYPEQDYPEQDYPEQDYPEQDYPDSQS